MPGVPPTGFFAARSSIDTADEADPACGSIVRYQRLGDRLTQVLDELHRSGVTRQALRVEHISRLDAAWGTAFGTAVTP